MTDTPHAAAPPADARLLVACLCARWCRTCDDYRTTFERIAQSRPGARFVWIDIEDDAEIVDDIDVDDFPTLLIVVDGAPRFFGPLTPQPATLERLLAWADTGAQAAPGTIDDTVRRLAQRLTAGGDAGR